MRLIASFHPDRLRSSRALLCLLITFFSTQVLLGILVDRNPDIRFPWRAALAGRIREAGRPPEVVLLGSSRSQGLFFSFEVPSRPPAPPEPWILNAAAPGCGGACAEQLLDGILGATAASPRLVIVEVSPEMVSRATLWLKLDFERTLTWRHVPEALPSLIPSRTLMRFLAWGFDPVYERRRQLWQIAGVSALEGPTDPPDSPPPSPAVAPAPAEVTNRSVEYFRRWLLRFELGGPNARSLSRILETCRVRGIKAVLFSSPLTRAHRDLYTPNVEASYRGFLDGLVRAHGCRLLDWRSRFPDEAFRDSNHLSATGIQLATTALRGDIVVPLLEAR